jgi:hypothetical protein
MSTYWIQLDHPLPVEGFPPVLSWIQFVTLFLEEGGPFIPIREAQVTPQPSQVLARVMWLNRAFSSIRAVPAVQQRPLGFPFYVT